MIGNTATVLPFPAKAAIPLLPPESPMPMPVQSFREGQLIEGVRPSAPRGMGWRRGYVIGTTVAMTAAASYMMMEVLVVGGFSLLDMALMVLFVGLFAWIALSFASALAGFVSVMTGAGKRLGIDPQAPLPPLSRRTALLMPTYNEDPHRLLAGLQAICESVRDTGQAVRFDFFVLSDTTKADIAEEELRAFAALRARLAGINLFYRHRTDNSGRKAGNIADWVRCFGGAYPHFLILDADSLMTGDTIVRLAAAMERNDDVALIQTLPVVVNGSTLFARIQQFGGRVYGPVVAHGVAWWHGAESNYWGHNAIIRTRAFAEQAGLPALTGRKPFGGHVLSHDFVEAALMRRGGWALFMVPGLQGSYEEGPPSLTDLLVRDRRWCQGNLQHMGVLPAKGLHWVSRWHFMIGIGHYFTAPMWAMLMLIGLAIPLYNSGFALTSFALPGFSPAQYWRDQDPVLVTWVFVATMGVLLAPKLLGYIVMLFDPVERRGCGGALRAAISVLLETLLAALMAPVTMYIQSRGVAEVLSGRDSGWESQRRDDGSLPLSALLRNYGGLTLFGLLIGAMAYAVSPVLALWMSPVIAGMVLAIPVVALTSAHAPGQALLRLGLLRIPEEAAPPEVLRRARELRAATTSAR